MQVVRCGKYAVRDRS